MLVICQKNDYNAKLMKLKKNISTNHGYDQYISTQEFNKLK